jgi:hypothetical protein
MKQLLSVLVAGLCFGVNLPAQVKTPSHAPDLRAPFFIAPLYFPAKAGAPFMAIARTRVVRILPEGSTITSENQRVVARDMDGRIFQERRSFTPVPNPENRQSMVQLDEYSDPVAHMLYRCSPQARVCNLFPYMAPMAVADRPVGVQPGRRTYLTRENLGTELLDGQEVLHTRETLTVYAGTIGNTGTIIRKVDYWYSPQLGINIKEERHDPRDGDQTLWLSDMVLSVADPSVFQIPSGYRIIDHRRPQAQTTAGGAQ